MKLALGTVQFGIDYGIAGRGQIVPDDEVRSILAFAYESGIHTLDTASAYGDIELRLSALCGECDFEVVSKIPAIPLQLSSLDLVGWVLDKADTSFRRLDGRMRYLMFHRAEDLLVENGEEIWGKLLQWAESRNVIIGASCYDPLILPCLMRFPGFGVAQVPGNALDQRILNVLDTSKIQIHLRSVFLQGLLLMPLQDAVSRLPACSEIIRKWHAWCDASGLSQLEAALGVAKSFQNVDYCVVGVDRIEQLQQICSAWERVPELPNAGLQCNISTIIDPRFWRVSSWPAMW